jgi:BON domain
MLRNTINSDFAAASSPPPARVNCKSLLWFSLLLTLAVGCASSPNRPAVAHSYKETPVPIVPPVYERQATDLAIRDGIYAIFMADRKSGYSPSADVKDGVVTLHGYLPRRAARQKLIDRIRAVPGVVEVKDERGEVALTRPQKFSP